MTAPYQREPLFSVIEKVKKKKLLNDSDLTGENVNHRDEQGRNILYWAIKHHNIYIAKLLIEHEISLMVTPTLHGLFHAIDEDHYELVILLIQSGINPNIIDNQGRSVLMRAIEKEQFRTVGFLIRNGADIFQMDDHYCMALDYARRSKCLEIREYIEHVLAIIEAEEQKKFQNLRCGCK